MGPNLVFKMDTIFMADKQNVFLLYSSPTGQYRCRHISGFTYMFGVDKTMGRFVNCFCGGHFEIQDGRHIGSNLVTISPASRDKKIITKCVRMSTVYAPHVHLAKCKHV